MPSGALPPSAEETSTRAVATAADATQACRAVADLLLQAGYSLPSVYLERGGRLRCLAVHGYRQLFDGIAPGVGVIGRTYTTGQATVVRDAGADGAYRQAVEAVVDEICVPVRGDGRTLGAINVEGVEPLPAGTLELLETLADALSARLAELGLPQESAAQRLVRHATGLAEARTADELAQRSLAAAVDLGPLSSAAIVGDRPCRVLAARGPLAPALRELPPAALDAAVAWVEAGGSSRTSPEPDGFALAGQQEFRQAGAETLVLIGTPGIGDEVTALLVADASPAPVGPEVVESLELLAALATAHLRSLRATERLQQQASTDALTGLPHRRGFHEALAAALSGVRGSGAREAGVRGSGVRGSGARGTGGREAGRRRLDDLPAREVAVVMIDLDGFKVVNDSHGHAAGDALLQHAAEVLSGALRSSDDLYRLGGDEFASVLDVPDAGEAVAVAGRLLAAVRQDATLGSISLGVAVARPDEPPPTLLARADAALYVVKNRGKDGLHLAT